MNIEDTFGYQLAESRVVKGWTERQVAEAVNHAPRETFRPFTEQSVKDWQEFKAVPANEIVELLAVKLIDENLGIDAARKPAMRETFIKAADRDRKALARGEDLHDLFLEGQSPFGQMLKTMRSKNNLTEARLATLCEHQEQTEQVTTNMILRLQYGLEQPSPALAARIAKVMELDLADVVLSEKPAFVDMAQGANDAEPLAKVDEPGYDFEQEAAEIGKDLRSFLADRQRLEFLPPCMKPIRRGDLPPLPGSEQVPYKEDRNGTARVISAMNKQLNETGALVGAVNQTQWQGISKRWRDLAEAYQQQRREAGVGTAASIG